jgi:hypothetical protein
VLASFHDDLDAAVLEVYGWQDLKTQPASDATLFERLVQLNAERSAEEAQNQIRWLRPEFQAPAQTQTPMAGLGDAGQRNVPPDAAPNSPTAPAPWPLSLPEQIAALASALKASAQSEQQLAARFTGKGKWKTHLPELLATLAALGRARQLEDGRWMG